MSETAADTFERMRLPYQIERFSIEDDMRGGLQASITYLDDRDVWPGHVEFRSVVFNVQQEHLERLVADVLRRLCGLIDAEREGHPSRRRAPRESVTDAVDHDIDPSRSPPVSS